MAWPTYIKVPKKLSNGLVAELSEKFGQQLRTTARKSDRSFRHACVILDSRLNLICFDYNRLRVHAEEGAIAKWLRAYRPRKRFAYLLFVVRVTNTGLFALSKPCDRCQKLAEIYRIRIAHT